MTLTNRYVSSDDILDKNGLTPFERFCHRYPEKIDKAKDLFMAHRPPRKKLQKLARFLCQDPEKTTKSSSLYSWQQLRKGLLVSIALVVLAMCLVPADNDAKKTVTSRRRRGAEKEDDTADVIFVLGFSLLAAAPVVYFLLREKLFGKHPTTVGKQDDDFDAPAAARQKNHDNNVVCRLSWEGIDPRWFTTVFVGLPEVQRMMEFGCPMWFLREFAILELLKKYQRLSGQPVSYGPAIESLHLFRNDEDDESLTFGGPVSQKSTVFISFTGSYSISHFSELMHHKDLEGQFVWIDTFCVDQFAWTTDKGPDMAGFKAKFAAQLREKVAKIGNTCLLIGSWYDIPKTLGQLWVLWELFSTAQGEAQLTLLFTAEEHESFIQNGLNKGNFDLDDTLAQVNVQRAVAFHVEDKQIILKQMKHIGLSKVNRIISQCLSGWVQICGKAYVKHIAATGEYYQHLSFMSNLASVYHSSGKYDDAEVLLRACLEKRMHVLGEDHPDTLTSMNNLATVLNSSGKYEDAEVLLRASLEKRMHTLGENHPHTLDSMNNLASVL